MVNNPQFQPGIPGQQPQRQLAPPAPQQQVNQQVRPPMSQPFNQQYNQYPVPQASPLSAQPPYNQQGILSYPFQWQQAPSVQFNQSKKSKLGHT